VASSSHAQQTFRSPDDAVSALVAAVKSGYEAGMFLKVLELTARTSSTPAIMLLMPTRARNS